MRPALILSLVFLSILSNPAAGGPSAEPRMLIHLGPVVGSKNACANGSLADCDNAVTAGDLYPASPSFAYILVERGGIPNLRAVSVGVMYQTFVPLARRDRIGIDVFGWYLCADSYTATSHWTDIAADPGGSTTIYWNDCQSDREVVAGYFYVAAYSDDVLKLQNGSISDCCFENFQLGNAVMGSAAYSAGAATHGCNPCLADCPGPPTVYVEPQCTQFTPPALLLHVSAPVAKNACLNGPPMDPGLAMAEGEVSTGSGPFFFVYLLGARGQVPDVAGFECGINYETGSSGDMLNGQAIDIYSWSSCGSVSFPTAGWPRPGTGISIGWNGPNCLTNKVAVAGYFYMGAYATDKLRLEAHPDVGAARLTSCTPSQGSPFLIDPEHLGFASFSPGATVDGCNPIHALCPGPTSGILPDARPPVNFSARPNPFQDRVMLAFNVEHPGHGRLDVFDVQGRVVAKLYEGVMAAGSHEIAWDGRRSGGGIAPAGAYYLRLEVDGRESGQKVVRRP